MIPKLENPTLAAGCYTLHLYCDRDRPAWEHGTLGEFTGETFAECKREARLEGWIVRNDGTATCPTCNPGFVKPKSLAEKIREAYPRRN